MKNLKSLFFTVFMAGFILTSCKKGDDSPTVVANTNLNMVNASADTLNIYVNGTRINRTNSVYPQGASDYLLTPAGEQNYQFKKYKSQLVLFSLPLKLDSGVNYSLFVAGATPDNVFLYVDTLKTNAPANSSLVRFVNTTPNAGSLDVQVGAVASYKAIAFKTVTNYLPFTSGIVTIRIYKAGTTQLLSNETKTLSGGAYTLFTKGDVNGTGAQAFGTGLISN